VIDLSEFLASYRQPLESERWAGAIDNIGGEVLAAVLSGMAYGSKVACWSNMVTTMPLLTNEISRADKALGKPRVNRFAGIVERLAQSEIV
jgi:hypothetical protein